MGSKIAGIFSNESPFGRAMNKCGIVIVSNVMFWIFSIPLITVGASMCGMYQVMLKMRRGDGDINPFKQFWTGFKSNFKQATIAWLIAAALLLFGYVDYRICEAATGGISNMKFIFLALGLVWAFVVIYLFPTITAFENKLGKLLSNAIFFVVKNPVKAILVFLIYAILPVLMYMYDWLMPLFAFVWTFFGFGLIGFLASKIILSEFRAYLPEVDEYGDFVEN